MIRRPPRCRSAAGGSYVEALAFLAILGMTSSVATLTVGRQLARHSVMAAAERLASEIRLRRAEAMTRGVRIGLVFQRGEEGWQVALYEDGDGDDFSDISFSPSQYFYFPSSFSWPGSPFPENHFPGRNFPSSFFRQLSSLAFGRPGILSFSTNSF